MTSTTELSENDFDIEDIFGKKKRIKAKKTEHEKLFDNIIDDSTEFDTLLDSSEAKAVIQPPPPQSAQPNFSVRFSVNDTKLDFKTLSSGDSSLETQVEIPVGIECNLTLDQILGDTKSKLLYEEEIDHKLKCSSSPSTSYSDKSAVQTLSDKTKSEVHPTLSNIDDINDLSNTILSNFAELSNKNTTTIIDNPKSAENSDPSCSPVEASFQDICQGDAMIFDLESDIASPISHSPEDQSTAETTSPDSAELGDLADFINTSSIFATQKSTKVTTKLASAFSSLPNNLLATDENPLAMTDDDIDNPFGPNNDEISDFDSVTSSVLSADLPAGRRKWSSYLKLPSKTSKESAKTYYHSYVSRLKSRVKKNPDSPTAGLLRGSRNSREQSPALSDVQDFKDIDSNEEGADSAVDTTSSREMSTPKPCAPKPVSLKLADPIPAPPVPTPEPIKVSWIKSLKFPALSLNNFLPKLTSSQQIRIVQGCFIVFFASVMHTLILSDNEFLKGISLGAFVSSVLCGLITWIIMPSPRTPPSKEALMNRDRLRALTESETVKDWFQYSPDFTSQTKIKQLPYLYCIMTDTILTLHSSTSLTPENPEEEAQQIIGPIICHIDITGCRVSVEPKENVTRNNMWKKRLPIWLRKPASFESRGEETKWQYGIDALVENYEKTYPVTGRVEGMYLFHKQCRYKEMWYELLRKTAREGSLPIQHKPAEIDPEWDVVSSLRGTTVAEDYVLYMNRLFEGIPNNIEDNDKEDDVVFVNVVQTETNLTVEEVIGQGQELEARSPSSLSEPGPSSKVTESQETITTDIPPSISTTSGNPNVAWANALFGRFVWNIIRDNEWKKRIKDRIEKKLVAIQLPKNLGPLVLKDFNLGNTAPLITKALLPRMDKQGVWIEMDISWDGDVDLTLETNLNIQMEHSTSNNSPCTTTFSPMSLESPTPAARSRIGSKLSATVGHYLKKGAEKLNKIPIQLTVKVQNVAGRVCVNIAPPPTDCLWYGFKSPPNLDLSIKPKLGSYQINNTHMLSLLERRLKKTFEDTFVLPSMESIVLPGMRRDMIFGPSDPTIHTDALELSDLLDVA